MCDRACLFCADRYGRVADPDGYVDETRLGELRLLQRPDYMATRRAAIEEALRRASQHEPSTQVAWTGMDCLASPLFDDALALAHALGFTEMELQSPGTRLTESGFARQLARSGVGGVSLTAHGHRAETFDYVNGRPGSHAAFWQAARAVLEAGMKLRVSAPILQQNLAELPELAAELAALDAPVTLFYYHDQDSLIPHYPRLAVPFDQLRPALERVRERVAPRRVTLTGVPPCALSHALREHFPWDYGRGGGHHSHARFESLPICSSCPHASACPGAPIQYLAHFGTWTDNALLDA
ncbi:MAG: radical SAM protein [Myxococcales bacterium]|nr:radical SAM protein [Myxococcales bacterium]